MITNLKMKGNKTFTSGNVKLTCEFEFNPSTNKVTRLSNGNILINDVYSGYFDAYQNVEGTALLYSFRDIPSGGAQNSTNLDAMVEEIEEELATNQDND